MMERKRAMNRWIGEKEDGTERKRRREVIKEGMEKRKERKEKEERKGS